MMPARSLFSIVESPMHPDFSALYARLGIKESKFSSIVRQFAHVDKAWLDRASYPRLQAWLDYFLQSALFLGVGDGEVPAMAGRGCGNIVPG